jgi:hypothetical protein
VYNLGCQESPVKSRRSPAAVNTLVISSCHWNFASEKAKARKLYEPESLLALYGRWPLKEYDLAMSKTNEFIDWYKFRAAGTGDPFFMIEKTYNKGSFSSRKDYIIFDKIRDFEVNQ